MWHVTIVFHHLQEVEELERLKESKQDEEKKELEGQLKKTIARRDLALVKSVLTSLLINTCTLTLEGC